MTIRLVALALIALASRAQAPTVVASTTITASAGGLSCTATPGVNAASVSTMHVVCTSGATTLHTSDSTVPSVPGTGIVVSVSSGTNAITWLLTKGNPAPDGWQVAATDGTTTRTKTGTF